MNKKSGTISLVLSIIAACLSIVAVLLVQKSSGPVPSAEDEKDIQYVMFLGTNHKDTNEPVFTPEEAKEKAAEILTNRLGGYTISEADGGWKDGDIIYKEHSLIIYLSDTDLESVHDVADELIDAFSQSSILIQKNETSTEFYSGE